MLDIAEQDTSRDNSHLFVRHPGLVQSLGPLKSKMNFRPSSLDSRSHKQLTAIVDKRHAKVRGARCKARRGGAPRSRSPPPKRAHAAPPHAIDLNPPCNDG